MKFPHDNIDAQYEQGDWYLVDFDGVLAVQIFPKPGIGKPIEKNIEKLNELVDRGKYIVIFTARPWGHYPEIRDWLDDHLIPYDQIVCGKPQAHRLIDDKAINSEEASWL